ncbi:MAG: PQQ-dependent sugar dehydrogenase [Neomegalonema sp.]|nr:PQQ-dependent sugar dehydrogenase [Neomegalonema sp.]
MVALSLVTLNFAAQARAQSVPAQIVESSIGPLRLEQIAGPFEHPWSLAFLPEGRMLVTERPGRLVLLDGDRRALVEGVPQVRARGQGGLLDIAVSPEFASDQTVFLSYAEPVEGGNGRTALGRARLDLSEPASPILRDFERIFAQRPAVSTSHHFGSRIVFAADGTLFLTTGDRGQRPLAQDLSTHLGKVIRLNRDGSVPTDNPFSPNSPTAQGGALPEIYSYGHRNMQGAFLNPVDGVLWTISHGARGGDEVNRVLPGRNYGWPEISYGRHYSGLKIGRGTQAPGMEQPVHYWDPSIAPSGASYYDAALLEPWRGSLFVGALAAQALVRLSLDGQRVTGEEVLISGQIGRIRDVRTGPEGALWLLTDDEEGALFRLTPEH